MSINQLRIQKFQKPAIPEKGPGTIDFAGFAEFTTELPPEVMSLIGRAVAEDIDTMILDSVINVEGMISADGDLLTMNDLILINMELEQYGLHVTPIEEEPGTGGQAEEEQKPVQTHANWPFPTGSRPENDSREQMEQLNSMIQAQEDFGRNLYNAIADAYRDQLNGTMTIEAVEQLELPLYRNIAITAQALHDGEDDYAPVFFKSARDGKFMINPDAKFDVDQVEDLIKLVVLVLNPPARDHLEVLDNITFEGEDIVEALTRLYGPKVNDLFIQIGPRVPQSGDRIDESVLKVDAA